MNYTKEMYDQGIKCEVGMNCNVQTLQANEPEPAKLLGWYKSEVWVLLVQSGLTVVVQSDKKVILPV